MKDLNIATGIETFRINEDFTYTFCPTDALFVAKLFSAFDAVEQKQEEYSRMTKNAEGAEIFAVAARIDEDVRSTINEALGCDICSAVFGEVCVMSLADGLPLWVNLMLALMDEIDTSFAREQKRTNPRIAKYTSKYQQKQKA